MTPQTLTPERCQMWNKYYVEFVETENMREWSKRDALLNTANGIEGKKNICTSLERDKMLK